MAITVTAQMTGQQITSTTTYCYLYEPLKIEITESDASSEEIYIDLVLTSIVDGSVVQTEEQYGLFDRNPDEPIIVDLMEMAQQLNNSNVLTLGKTSEISGATNIPVSEYKYEFQIYSDITTTKTSISKLPIIGGRLFRDFAATVSSSQNLTEAELYGVDLTGRWLNYPNISQSLTDPTATDARPTITVSTETTANQQPCGGMLIWKSRLGGWMYWGMDISIFNSSGSYGEKVEVGMMEVNSSGNPYIQPNYSQRDNSYSYSLKAFSLSTDELRAVQGISNSIAVYYMQDENSSLELMELSSVSAPVSTLANGGDFSVTLKNISTTSQKSR